MQMIAWGAPTALLRNPNHEAHLARRMADRPGTATMKADEVVVAPHLWNLGGNLIMTMDWREIDIERIDRGDEEEVFSVTGWRIYLHKARFRNGKLNRRKSVLLLTPEASMRSDRKRTMNRFLEKADNLSLRSTSKSLWSLLFWVDIMLRMEELEDEL